MMNHNQIKLTDSQNAFAYAMYMMVSSNFKDAFCDSRITEEWLHFQYKQQKGDIQDQMADKDLEERLKRKYIKLKDFRKIVG